MNDLEVKKGQSIRSSNKSFRCKLRNIYSVIVEQKKLEGFDLIFTRIPEISLYQILLFIGASYTIIVSGQVQTGSVFLNAKPEQYRCKNKLDSFPDATYQNAHFASGKFHLTKNLPQKLTQKPNTLNPAQKPTENRVPGLGTEPTSIPTHRNLLESY